MLDFDDPHWRELSHAHGAGADIPEKLLNIETADDFPQPLWDDLLDRLCHQCTVGSASLAAFPHLVRIADEHANEQTAIEAIRLAAFILCFAIGPDDQLPALAPELDGPFREAIVRGKTVLARLLSVHRSDFQATLDFLAAVAAFDLRVDAARLLDALRDGHLDCPACETRVAVDDLYTI